jgi:hypothetical protein
MKKAVSVQTNMNMVNILRQPIPRNLAMFPSKIILDVPTKQ